MMLRVWEASVVAAKIHAAPAQQQMSLVSSNAIGQYVCVRLVLPHGCFFLRYQ